MESIIADLQRSFGAEEIKPQTTCDNVPTVWIAKDKTLEILRYLKNAEKPYRMLFDLTAID